MRKIFNVICNFCKKEFQRDSRSYRENNSFKFCNKQCRSLFDTQKLQIKCDNCQKLIFRKLKDHKKSKNHFCNHSCAATYNNTHKTKGTRISKLEIYIQNKLKEIYPNLNFHFNQTDTISSELDIYIPSLKLAFELNGIFHYEPIYGQEKLNQIQKNDNRKF